MKFLVPLILALGIGTAVAAGPFDDLSAEDRAKLGGEIRSFLLENPDVLVEVLALIEEQRQQEEALADMLLVQQNYDALVNDGVSYVGGNPDGDVTIVEFLDYQCGYCKRAHPEVAQLLAQDGNIRIIQKEFPILGPVSQTAARAASAVLLGDGPEVYATFSDRLLRHEGRLNDAIIARLARDSGADVDAMRQRASSPEVTEMINNNIRLAQAMQISGTPTFIIGGQMLRGYLPLEGMQAIVAEERSEM